MSASIRQISYSEILQAPNAPELLGAYADECSIEEIGKAMPQAHIYEALEAGGLMHCFGVFKGETLIGFASLLTSILPHYGAKVATIESIFILPNHRVGGIGRILLAFLEQFADEQECVSILYSAPTDSKFDKLLHALPDYRHSNNVYVRRVN